MPDYTSNLTALLTGHLGLPAGGPDKSITDVSGKDKSKNRTPADTSLDVSDLIGHAVAGGYTSFSDDSIKSSFNYLSGIIGRPQAQKLFTQAFLYNQRPDAKQKTPEQKLQSFYDIGSSDPATNKILQSVKNQGAGVQARFDQSTYEGNKEITGQFKAGKAVDTDQSNQLLSSISKKTNQ